MSAGLLYIKIRIVQKGQKSTSKHLQYNGGFDTVCKHQAVKRIRNIAIYHYSPVRVALLLFMTLLLGACSSVQVTRPTPPPLLNSGPEIQVADVDVLAVSPAMDEFLERYILKYDDKQTRLYLLANSVTSNGILGFEYDVNYTLTASEAFERRTGNCIGFANMMVALARRAGLKAKFQEVLRQPVWFSHDDTVLVIKHTNVIVESPRYTFVLDVSGIKINPSMQRREITDDYAKALYLNNIGAEALLRDDLPTAHAYLSSAIAVEPTLVDSWVNMGVVFGRNEQLDDAVTVYNQALNIDPTTQSALSNLHEIYIEQGDLESAKILQARVDRYRQRNPYHLLNLSEEALEQARFEDSLRLLKKAIRKKDDEHLLYFAMAKTQYLSGEYAAAEESLNRARELAPADIVAEYDRPWIELVAKEED